MDITQARAAAAFVAIVSFAAFLGVGDSAHARAASSNPSVYSDPTGDANGRVDISRVAISNTAGGVIDFEISIANAGVLLSDDAVIAVVIDADRNDSTGTNGFEYAINSWGSTRQASLVHWDGFKMVEVPAPSLIKIWQSDGTLTLRIARHDLNDTSGFYAWVASWSPRDPSAGDDWDDEAPDGSDTYDYALSMPHVTGAVAHFAPSAPRAGRRFAVSGVTFALQSDEKVSATGFRCRATISGKALRGSGAGGCSFALPRDSKKKRLSVTTTATVGDESRTLRNSFVVR